VEAAQTKELLAACILVAMLFMPSNYLGATTNDKQAAYPLAFTSAP
jgi:hypothetical protein